MKPIIKPRANKFLLKMTHQCDLKAWYLARQTDQHTLQQLTVFEQGKYVEREAIMEMDNLTYMPDNPVIAARLTLQQRGQSAVIFQPAFETYGIILRPDILNTEQRKITEIKSSKRVKDDHILDVAYSTAAARNSNFKIDKMEIMHLNPEYQRDNDEPLMITVDVTSRVMAVLDGLNLVERIKSIQSSVKPPAEQKKICRDCDFSHMCFDEPSSIIANIPRLSQSKMQAMLSFGIETLSQLLANEEHFDKLTDKQQLFVQDCQDSLEDIGHNITINTETMGINYPWILEEEHLHMDFETSASAIPLLDGEKPWQPTLTQFSVTWDDGQTFSECGYLMDGNCDDQEQLVDALIVATSQAPGVPIVVYHEAFEKKRLIELAQAYPSRTQEIMAIHTRVVDLLPVVKESVTGLPRHTLKTVAPILNSGFSYDGLKINNGAIADAVMTLMRIDGGPEILKSNTGMSISEARNALLAYCRRDTLGTAVIVRQLRKHLKSV